MTNQAIVVGGQELATDTDLLSGTRLSPCPANGRVTLQFQADLNDATNNWRLTVQLPSNEVPVSELPVPGSNPSLAGVMDDRQILSMTYDIQQGGNLLVAVTETGAAILDWRAIWTPT